MSGIEHEKLIALIRDVVSSMPAPADPQAVRSIDEKLLAARYVISERLARNWLREMVGVGIVRKRGRVRMGTLGACDAWVLDDGRARRRYKGAPR